MDFHGHRLGGWRRYSDVMGSELLVFLVCAFNGYWRYNWYLARL